MIGAIVWVEHGEPEVKHRRHAGSRLVKAVLDGYGGVRLDLNNTGLAVLWRLIRIVLARGYRSEPAYHASVAANRTHIRRDTECGAEYRRCYLCHEPRLANRSLTRQA